MKFFITLLLLSTQSFAVDLTNKFKIIYQQQKELTLSEQAALRKYDIHLIPGILAESLVWSDPRSSVDISLITKDYYHVQLKVLNEKYNIPARRMLTSSYDVNETRLNIRKAISEAKSRNRKVLFVSHSLGGLALIEELISEKSAWTQIGGIAFLQSPFHGSPLGELVINPPYELNDVVAKILPRLNISYETLHFVSPPLRKKFMAENRDTIRDLIKKVPLFTMTGVADSNTSMLKPLIDIMEAGCLRGYTNKCVTDVFFNGPYDKSDGFIPYKSSFLENADFIKLDKVDHVEIILNAPYEDYKKEHLTTTILRLLLERM